MQERSPVRRTDLSQWKTIEIPHQGVSVEMPADAHGMKMHPHPNFMCDSVWMFSVSIEKETAEQRKDMWQPSEQNPLSRNQDYMNWLKWTHELHKATSTWESGKRREYRHDIQNPDGSVVRAHITYVFGWFAEEEQQQDEAAIKRIIASVRPIIRKDTQQGGGEERR